MSHQRRWTLFALALAAAGSGLFCGAPEAQDSAEAASSSNVVAQVGERKITLEELDDLVKTRNAKAYQQFYDARRQMLDVIINEEVVKAEATAKGVTEQELQQEISKDVPTPSEGQILAFYEQNQSRMGGRTLDQVKDQIRSHLISQQSQTKLIAYVAELKRKAGVKIFLDPPRMEVKIAETDPSKGPKDAPILLVEYSDFQ